MSKDPISEGDQDVSRRRLLEKAALAVGAATALARSCDVAMDSAGRVLIHGAALPAQRPEGSFEVAAGNAGNCVNTASCGGTVNGGLVPIRGPAYFPAVQCNPRAPVQK
jgi:hypothetical protein